MTFRLFALTESCASGADILEHLKRCDLRYCPPLSDRVDLLAYSNKLHQQSVCFEAWGDGGLIGLVAAYFNTDEGKVFVSNVSVDLNFSGRGVSDILMNMLMVRAMSLGIFQINLRVSSINESARRFYERHGFFVFDVAASELMMRLEFSKRV